MRIGFYGGSFNPIHNGHISLARQILTEAQLDEVWFVVSPHNPLKAEQELMPDADRLKMVEEALADEPKMRASECEFRMPRPSYTQHTLEVLRREYPQNQFVLLIGADNWNCFRQWRNYGDILKNHEIAVYPRRGCDIDAASLPENVRLLDTELLDVSSTQVRKLVGDGLPIAGIVPPCVEKYMENYRKSKYIQ